MLIYFFMELVCPRVVRPCPCLLSLLQANEPFRRALEAQYRRTAHEERPFVDMVPTTRRDFSRPESRCIN